MNTNEHQDYIVSRIIEDLYSIGEDTQADDLLQNHQFLEYVILNDNKGGLNKLLQILGQSTSKQVHEILRAVNQSQHLLSDSPEQLLFQLDLRLETLDYRFSKNEQAAPSIQNHVSIRAKPSSGLKKELLYTYKTGWSRASVIRGTQLGTFGSNEILLFEVTPDGTFRIVGRRKNELIQFSLNESFYSTGGLTNRRLVASSFEISAVVSKSETELYIAWKEDALNKGGETQYFIGIRDDERDTFRRLAKTTSIVTSLNLYIAEGYLIVGLLGAMEFRNIENGNVIRRLELSSDDKNLAVRDIHLFDHLGGILIDAASELIFVRTSSFEIEWRLNYWKHSHQTIDDIPLSTQFERILCLNDHEFIATDFKSVWKFDARGGIEVDKCKTRLGAPVCLVGKKIAFVDNNICHLATPEDFTIVASLESPTGSFQDALYLQDQNELISIHSDGNLRHWSVDAISDHSNSNKSDNTIRRIQKIVTAKWLDGIIVCDDIGRVIKVDHDGNRGTLQTKFGKSVTCIKAHETKTLIAAGTGNGSFRLWNPISRKAVINTSFGSEKICDCSFVDDANIVLVTTETGLFALSFTSQEIKVGHRYCRLSRLSQRWTAKPLPDSQHALCVSEEGQFAIVDFRSMKLIAHWGGEYKYNSVTPKIAFTASNKLAVASIGQTTFKINFANGTINNHVSYGSDAKESSLHYIQRGEYFLLNGGEKIELSEIQKTNQNYWKTNRILDGEPDFKVTDISPDEKKSIGMNGNTIILYDLERQSVLGKFTLESRLQDVKFAHSMDRIYVADEVGELIVLDLKHQVSELYNADRLLNWANTLYCNCTQCNPDLEMFGYDWVKTTKADQKDANYLCSKCLSPVKKGSVIFDTSLTEKTWFKAHSRNAYVDDNICKFCGYTHGELFQLERNFWACRNCIEDFNGTEPRLYQSSLYRECQCCGITQSDFEGIQFRDYKFQAMCQRCTQNMERAFIKGDISVFDKFAVRQQPHERQKTIQTKRNRGIWNRIFRSARPDENHTLGQYTLREFRRGKQRALDAVYADLLDNKSVEILHKALKSKIIAHPGDLYALANKDHSDTNENLRLIILTLMSRIPPKEIDRFAELLELNPNLPGAYWRYAQIVSDYPYYWFRRAEIAYHKAIERTPGNQSLLADFAEFLYKKMMRNPEAKRYFDAALTIDDSKRILFKSAAFHLHVWEDVDEKARYEDALLKIAPNNIFEIQPIFSEYSKSLAKLGEASKAIDVLVKLKNTLTSNSPRRKTIDADIQKILNEEK